MQGFAMQSGPSPAVLPPDTPSRTGPEGDGGFVFEGRHYRSMETYAAACRRFELAKYIELEVTVRY